MYQASLLLQINIYVRWTYLEGMLYNFNYVVTSLQSIPDGTYAEGYRNVLF